MWRHRHLVPFHATTPDKRNMDRTVDFDSILFHPFLSDEAQVNPRIYGAELAFWLSRKLAGRGIETSYPRSEDWGWYLEYSRQDGKAYLLRCANFDGNDSQWRCIVEPRGQGMLGLKKAPLDDAAPLLQALRSILSSEGDIHNVTWSDEGSR